MRMPGEKVNPEISRKFLEAIRNQRSETVAIEGIHIKTCPGVFPPQSPFSQSSKKLHELFGNLKDSHVLDMGTGTGFQAIQAAKAGAGSVIAVDINPAAIVCATENVILNDVAAKVSIFKSDLFEKIPEGASFDLVIANLPIVDFPLEGVVEAALYDPDYRIHKRFLAEVGGYLIPGGSIIMTHINFNGPGDFEAFEAILQEYGYRPEQYMDIENMDFLWRIYRIGPIIAA